MSKKFKVKKKDSGLDKFIGGAGRFFKKAPNIVDLNDTPMQDKCLMIGSHSGAGGPFHYRTFQKKRFMTWGAHPMCEGFNARRKYLYHVFYRQKLGYGKLKSFLLSIGFGLISKIIYGYAGIIPTYYDSRIFLTYKYSFECLKEDVSVFIFPEDSSKGYLEEITRFWPGFIHLSKLYYKRHKVDLPVYTLFYKSKPKNIVIAKPMYINKLLETHTENEVMEIFRKYLNSLNDFDENGFIGEKNKEFFVETTPKIFEQIEEKGEEKE